ncbi:hypothetical protein [Endothiovibrio diazotrophicus]
MADLWVRGRTRPRHWLPDRRWWYGAAAILVACALLAGRDGGDEARAPARPPLTEVPPLAPVTPPRVSAAAQAAFAERKLFGLKEPAADGRNGDAAQSAPPAEAPSADDVPALPWTLRGVVIREGRLRAVFEDPNGAAPTWIYLAEGERREGVEVVSIAADRVRLRTDADGRTFTLRLFAFGDGS